MEEKEVKNTEKAQAEKKPEKTKEEIQAERREARRRRRQRNQILAYLLVIFLIILLAVGVILGIHYVSGLSDAKEREQQGQQEVVDGLLSSEQELTVPEESQEEPEPVVELTYEQKLDQIVNAAIEVMPIEDKVAGLFIVTPETVAGMDNVTEAGDEAREGLANYAVGGIVYSTKNIKGEEQFQSLLDTMELYSKYPVFQVVEEECGDNTQVVKAKLGEKTDKAVAIASAGDPAAAAQAGAVIGTYLQQLGINMNLAPVADLSLVKNSVVSGRSFGEDPEVVSEYVKNMITGMMEQGITPCIKHFPGLGSVKTDTDKGRAVSERTEEEFRAGEFAVYQKLIDAQVPAIMISNVSAPALTGDNIPCTLSAQVVTDILRKEMEFRGLIITDALNEKAVSEYYSSEEAAVMALKAGCDMLVNPENFEEAYNSVLEAVQNGTISEARIDDALKRIYRIKFADRVEK